MRATRDPEDENCEPQELLQEKELWEKPIMEELTQLVEGKGVLQRIDATILRQLQKEHRTVEIVPSKMVLTLKPRPRRRARMVGCGNFCQKQEGQDLYAGGADTVAVRYVLKRGAEEGWTGCVIDIKAAFLNAPASSRRRRRGGRAEATSSLGQAGVRQV